MRSDHFIIGQLARISYIDGYSDGLNGMLGVAFVIRNRIRAGWWNGDWSEVLSHHKDYSCRIENMPDIIPDPRNHSFSRFLMQVDGIFSGATDDFVTIKPSGEVNYLFKEQRPPVALYYARLNEITNEKFMNDIPRRPDLHPLIAQVGGLSFFG